MRLASSFVAMSIVAACTQHTRQTETSGAAQPAVVAGASFDAAAGPPDAIDLDEYGRDPDYRAPVPPPVVVTVDEQALLDELARIGRVFARDVPSSVLLAELGRPTSDPSKMPVSLDPTSSHLAVIHARLDPSYQEIEVRFFEPVAVAALMTRFGRFNDYTIDDREEPEYATSNLDVSGPFAVSLAITSYARSREDLTKDKVRVVRVQRTRR